MILKKIEFYVHAFFKRLDPNLTSSAIRNIFIYLLSEKLSYELSSEKIALNSFVCIAYKTLMM